MTEQFTLDHTVINVRFGMDRAAAIFEALGFTLTARGYHSLGSINHLMMFGTDYLELLGLPDPESAERPELSGAPIGLNGLVFKSVDVDRTFEHLGALEIAGEPPKAFSRPVDLADGPRDARFRTVAVRPGTFPAGRVYFCEHGTPELVWRPEWQSHANGAQRITEMVTVAAAPDEEARKFARLTGSAMPEPDSAGYAVEIAGGVRLSVLSERQYEARYGALALALGERASMFGALVIAADDLAAAGAIFAAAAGDEVTVSSAADSITVRVTEFDSLLEFTG